MDTTLKSLDHSNIGFREGFVIAAARVLETNSTLTGMAFSTAGSGDNLSKCSDNLVLELLKRKRREDEPVLSVKVAMAAQPRDTNWHTPTK